MEEGSSEKDRSIDKLYICEHCLRYFLNSRKYRQHMVEKKTFRSLSKRFSNGFRMNVIDVIHLVERFMKGQMVCLSMKSMELHRK